MDESFGRGAFNLTAFAVSGIFPFTFSTAGVPGLVVELFVSDSDLVVLSLPQAAKKEATNRHPIIFFIFQVLPFG